jgi:hypothetical protein
MRWQAIAWLLILYPRLYNMMVYIYSFDASQILHYYVPIMSSGNMQHGHFILVNFASFDNSLHGSITSRTSQPHEPYEFISIIWSRLSSPWLLSRAFVARPRRATERQLRELFKQKGVDLNQRERWRQRLKK